MKLCDRCLKNCESKEMVKFKFWQERLICIPCQSEFERQFENLIIDFFVTPSEDQPNSCQECKNEKIACVCID